ncbi:MAG: RsmE family RNA methyltransferase [Ginsengibacter sp.]
MPVPYFFEENIHNERFLSLSENTSKHIVQVLRLQADEVVMITDGKGQKVECRLTQADKRVAKVEVLERHQQKKSSNQISIGISPIKNIGRFEWFLEKATEIGIDEIILLHCNHTEKQNVRYDRMRNILVSAMLQSRQSWLPALVPLVKFTEALPAFNHKQKLIAHCNEGEKEALRSLKIIDDTVILIGPEGDFSNEEVVFAEQYSFKAVSLGNTILRTETAGIAAAIFLKLI